MKAQAKSSPKPVQGGEWVARFIFISGRLCLDFAQTGGEEERAVWERLRQPSDLADWLSESPLRVEVASATPAELQAALILREAIWQGAQAIQQGGSPRLEDIDIINRAAAAPDLPPQLAPDSLARTWQTPITATAAISTIARDAVDLFSSELRGRIRKCANPKCALMFVDASRPGKRRWCLMERCGNKVKTARYRHRHLGAAVADGADA